MVYRIKHLGGQCCAFDSNNCVGYAANGASFRGKKYTNSWQQKCIQSTRGDSQNLWIRLDCLVPVGIKHFINLCSKNT